MIMAMMAACGLWSVSWMMGKRLDSGWGVLLPSCLALAGGAAAVTVNFSVL